MPPSESKYPAHQKLAKVSPECQAIGAFYEWLTGEQHYVLCRWEKRSEETPGNDLGPDEQPLRYTAEGFFPASPGIQRLLGDYFGIDPQQLEQEQRAILDEIRALQAVRSTDVP